MFLLDEPLSNLDAQLRASARDELQQFQRRIGTTTIYVTHDQVEAMGLGDRIAVMKVRHRAPNRHAARHLRRARRYFRRQFRRFAADESGASSGLHSRLSPGKFSSRAEPMNGNIKGRGIPLHRDPHEYLGADRLIYGTLGGGFADQKVIARLPATVTDKIAAQTSLRFQRDGKRAEVL